jgi:hypothetical protein
MISALAFFFGLLAAVLMVAALILIASLRR